MRLNNNKGYQTRICLSGFCHRRQRTGDCKAKTKHRDKFHSFISYLTYLYRDL